MGNKTSNLHPKTIQELRAHVDVEFSAEEINDWFQDFKMSCSKGKTAIDIQGFVRIYNSLFKGDGSDFAYHVFRTFDTNNDGVVDFTEFIIGLCVSGSSNAETKMRWAFSMYDQNQDDCITRQEMTSVIQAVYKMSLPGGVEEKYSPENLTSDIFESMDTNKDNVISWKEFRQGIARHPVLVSLLQLAPNVD